MVTSGEYLTLDLDNIDNTIGGAGASAPATGIFA